MTKIRGQKRKAQEKDDLFAPLPSPRALISPSSQSDWWENFSTRFSGYTPDSLFKVSRKTFEYICGLVGEEMMTGQNYTDIRHEYLTLNDRVAIALRRLSTGESFEVVGNLFRVNISTAYQITWRFVEAIEKKGSGHLHWPKTEEQITEIKSKFEGIRGLPNCCGAIDSTKIMFCLSRDHAQRKIWCDQENNPCMILHAVVDPDMRFLDIIAGLPGCLREFDALREWSLFKLCEEGKRLNGKKLKLAENEEEIGEYIVGNGGFPLLPWLLTPYNEEKKLSDVQEDFNKRLYETLNVAKMAFERLNETWQVIKGVVWTPDKLKLPRIIYACCVLHNIMIDQNDAFVMQDASFLQSDDNGPQAHKPKCKISDKTASIQRDNLALYLSSKSLPFSSNGIESVRNLGLWQPSRAQISAGQGLSRRVFQSDIMSAPVSEAESTRPVIAEAIGMIGIAMSQISSTLGRADRICQIEEERTKKDGLETSKRFTKSEQKRSDAEKKCVTLESRLEEVSSKLQEAERDLAKKESELASLRLSHKKELETVYNSHLLMGFDDGAFHVMRCMRAFCDVHPSQPELERWLLMPLDHPELRVFHSEIPFNERLLGDFRDMCAKKKVPMWEVPAAKDVNLLAAMEKWDALGKAALEESKKAVAASVTDSS